MSPPRLLRRRLSRLAVGRDIRGFRAALGAEEVADQVGRGRGLEVDAVLLGVRDEVFGVCCGAGAGDGGGLDAGGGHGEDREEGCELHFG